MIYACENPRGGLYDAAVMGACSVRSMQRDVDVAWARANLHPVR